MKNWQTVSAKLTHTSDNIHSKRKNAPTFEYYECPIEIDEKGFNAVASIKVIIENVGNRRIYYHHYLGELKNQTVLNSSAPTDQGNNAVLLDGSMNNYSINN